MNQNRNVNLKLWEDFLDKFNKLKNFVSVAIVGKYTNLSESYKSLNEALFHSGIFNNTRSKLNGLIQKKLKIFLNVSKF